MNSPDFPVDRWGEVGYNKASHLVHTRKRKEGTALIDVTLLGTSATMPLPERALTSAHLAFGGRSILFDCGEGTQTAARRAQVSLMKTDLIALTHYHGDHLFGLPGLLQTFGCLGRSDPLFLTGPDGLEEAIRPILQLAGSLPFSVHPVTLPEGGTSLGSLLPNWSADAFLAPVPTCHRVPSQGYCFTLRRPGKFQVEAAKRLKIPQRRWGELQRGKNVMLENGTVITPHMVLGEDRAGLRVVFSGDTAPCSTLRKAAAGADLFLCEATYGDDSYAAHAALYGHCTFSQSARMASDAGARRLWLMHFSQILRQPEEALPYATAIYPDAVLGEDGMKITLNFT